MPCRPCHGLSHDHIRCFPGPQITPGVPTFSSHICPQRSWTLTYFLWSRLPFYHLSSISSNKYKTRSSTFIPWKNSSWPSPSLFTFILWTWQRMVELEPVVGLGAFTKETGVNSNSKRRTIMASLQRWPDLISLHEVQKTYGWSNGTVVPHNGNSILTTHIYWPLTTIFNHIFQVVKCKVEKKDEVKRDRFKMVQSTEVVKPGSLEMLRADQRV